MKNLKQTIEFIIEVYLFVFSGFLIGIGLGVGWLFLLSGFLMALITGAQIKRDAIKEYKDNKDEI